MQHLSIEAIKQRFGFDLTHVPYRNTPQSVTDMVAGHVAASLVEVGASVPLIREGKLRALAVTSSTRLTALPEVPPFAEAANAPGFEAVSWHALVGARRDAEGDRREAARRDEAHHGDAGRWSSTSPTSGLMPFDTPLGRRDCGLHQATAGDLGLGRAQARP